MGAIIITMFVNVGGHLLDWNADIDLTYIVLYYIMMLVSNEKYKEKSIMADNLF